MLREAFGAKREEVAGRCMALRDNAQREASGFALPNGQINSKSGGEWGKFGKNKMHKWVWQETPRGRKHLEDVSVDNRIILNWILKQLDGRASNEYMWLGTRTSGGLL